jgi:hypothetical protein
MLKNKNQLRYALISSVLIFFCGFINSNDALNNMWWIFLIQFIAAFLVKNDFEDKVYFIFSPSFLLVSYVNISFVLGGLAYKYNLIFTTPIFSISYFDKLKNMNLAIAFILSCSWIVLLSLNKIPLQKYSSDQKPVHVAKVIFIICLITSFSFVNIDFTVIGGVGDFSMIPKTILSIILFYFLSKTKTAKRLIYYVIVISIFVLTNFESKREALFLILPILFLESYFRNISIHILTIKKIIYASLAIPIIIFSILIMTIARGFGQYPVKNSLDAVRFMPELVSDHDINSLIMTTSEAPVTTFHSLHAISILNQDIDHLALGSTYFKVFFIFIPKQMFGYKPQSMTSIYTSVQDKSFASIGGSLPINVYAESFWNFHFFGLLFIFLLLYIFNSIYKKMYLTLQTKNLNFVSLTVLFALTHLIGFYRGYGFDLYSVFIIISLLFSFFFSKTILHIFKK